ncbi:MAG TPA: hypothetical protein VFX61_13590 [Micromonosporaceae bacterium]|nr:hypothetical protein [Micromonosporaceae bacterium]
MIMWVGVRIMSVLHRWSRSGKSRNIAVRRWQLLRAELARYGRGVASHRAGPPRHRRPHWWNAPTEVYPQVGRAGWLTPAQTWRANGGRPVYQPATAKP